MVSCAVIGAHPLFLDLLGDTLRLRRGLRITCLEQDATRAFADRDGGSFDVLVFDFDSLDAEGRAAAATVAGQHPGALVIAIAARAGGFTPPAWLAARSPVVVGKDESFATFLARLEQACGARLPAAAAAITAPRRHASLTEREAEIFGLLAEGLTTAEIAARLSRSFYTIQTHRKRITEKLGRLGSPLARRAAAHRKSALRPNRDGPG